MNLFALGINHETAPVTIRETVAFTGEKILIALEQLKNTDHITESIILSTCNRTEIYFTVKNTDAKPVIDWLHTFFELSRSSLQPYIYLHQDLQAIQHIMRVASGLNSLVLGEPQILGQMKEAYTLAHKSETVHHTLDHLFQHVFRTAKQVRTDTAIGSSPVSVAFAAVSLAKQFFGDLSEQTAILIGAGETIELVARHLHESKIGRIIIANRTFNRAHTLAESLGGYAIELAELNSHLHEGDLVISSTGSPTTLVHKADIKNALKKRRHRPMFMVDIAVPRDIEASISEFEDVYLYSVDDLQDIIAENKRSRLDAANAAEEIILMQAERFLCQHQAIQCVNPMIRAYRHQANSIKEQVVQQAMHQLQLGHSPTEVINKLAHQLTNKLIHTPSHQLHQAGIAGNQELIKMAEQLLFETDKPSNEKP